MKKKALLVILYITWIIPAHSQENSISSLRKELAQSKSDTSAVLLQVKLSMAYSRSKVDSCLWFAREAQKLSKKINYPVGLAKSANALGSYYFITSNHTKALENFIDVIKISKSINYKMGISFASTNIGAIYSMEGNFRAAIDYALKALPIFEQAHDSSNYNSTLINLASYYCQLPNLDSARIYCDKVYQILLKNQNIDHLGTATTLLGHIYFDMGRMDLALDFFRESASYSIAKKDYADLIDTYMSMAVLFLKTMKPDSADRYARKGLAFAEEIGNQNGILDIYKILLDINKSKNKDSTVKYLSRIQILQDSLFAGYKQKQMHDLKLSIYQNEEEMKAEEVLNRINNRNKLQYIGGSIAILTFLIFSIVLLNRKKTRSKNFLRIVEFAGLLAFLLTFEFANLFLHHYFEKWTDGIPMYMLFFLVVVGSILIPIHHECEKWVKSRTKA